MICSWRATALALAATFAVASNARAQVLEIGDDGAVTTFAAPMVHTDAGAQAIELQRPRSARAAPAAVRTIIADTAGRYGLSPTLLEAVAWQESRFRHDAVSHKGAVGVMQLMPGTARDLRVNPFDLAQNVSGGAAYLSQMIRRYDGDLVRGLAAYNAGPGAVDRHKGVPPFAETQAYVNAILGRIASTAPAVIKQ